MFFSPALLLLFVGGVSAAGSKVTFEVAGTYWCGDCSRFIDRAREMFEKYGGLNKVNFTYYPSQDCKKTNVNQGCATDQSALQACLKKYLNNSPRDYLTVLGCAQGGTTVANAVECVKKSPVAGRLNMLKQCGSGMEGRNYLAAEFDDYARVSAGLYWWPWTVIDGKRVPASERNPWGEVCKLLNPKPKECN